MTPSDDSTSEDNASANGDSVSQCNNDNSETETDACEIRESNNVDQSEIDMDTMPIGSSMEEIEIMNDNVKKVMAILDDQNDINMDNIETILQHVRLANIPSQYLREIYRNCLIQSRINTSNDDDVNKEACEKNESNNNQTLAEFGDVEQSSASQSIDRSIKQNVAGL